MGKAPLTPEAVDKIQKKLEDLQEKGIDIHEFEDGPLYKNYMDENGFYDDVFPFVVCYENGVFKYLHFLGCTRSQYRKIEYAGLRDYLEIMFVELEEKIQEVIA